MSEPIWVQLPRLFRTVRHLRLSQVGWRIRYMVQRWLETQRGDGFAEGVDAQRSGPPALRHAPPLADTAASPRMAELRAGRLTLLNEQRPFTGGDDWCLLGGRTRHRLWRYHLHYHGWLVDLAREHQETGDEAPLNELRHWLRDWIDVCQPGKPGFTHYPWNSFAIAQRLWHWREIVGLVPERFWKTADLPINRFLESVSAQGEYLYRHVEWDLRGNHLFKDAVGLAAAADLLKDAAPPAWRKQAARLAVSQVAEQILPDGAHFERSPMYHIQVMEDLLALIGLLRDDDVLATLRAAVQRMAAPLRWLQHPCGGFPLFNDAAENYASRPVDIERELAKQGLVSWNMPPIGLRHFPDAGVVAWRGSPWTVFFDVGEIGPDYQPGHAHADSLTIELSFAGKRLVVDPGTFCYDPDERRRYDRSTQAHNTVCVDEQDSSEVWHIFRVGRRARPVEVSVVEKNAGFDAVAAHTGYDHLRGAPRHRRRVRVEGETTLEISDEIIGEGRHRLEGGFLLAPEWSATLTPHGWALRHSNASLAVHLHANQQVDVQVATRPWHPGFGREVTVQRLVWSANATTPFRLQTTWRRG